MEVGLSPKRLRVCLMCTVAWMHARFNARICTCVVCVDAHSLALTSSPPAARADDLGDNDSEESDGGDDGASFARSRCDCPAFVVAALTSSRGLAYTRELASGCGRGRQGG
jgi:hypothetical protein